MGRSTPRTGYALMLALVLVVIVSLGAVVAVGKARTDAQREREEELLFVGGQFRAALRSYHAVIVSGTAGQYPQRLEDLVEDRRRPVTVHHLRRIYADPMTGEKDWVLVLQGDRIVGLHSRSELAPLRHGGFDRVDASFSKAHRYADWRFLAEGSGLPSASAAGSADGNPDAGAGAPPSGDENSRIMACMEQFMFPSSQCVDVPPPLGHDQFSCQAEYGRLYRACAAGTNAN